jgi:serine/threonine protein kinase
MMKELSLYNCRLDGRYDVQELLGRGSYAEIYVARDILASPQSPHSRVVIKALNVFMQNDLDADLERTLVENFQNEAIALDRVRHPNIISRLGHGTAKDLRGTVFHYLVLEYLPGGDLARACREKSLGLEKALDYLEQVCAGLGHAHNSGVIHRDIKPQNLLLTLDRETVKIADFGVARFAHSDSPITRVGTNIYAPPEHSPMFAGETGTVTVTELTPAADIYSLAKSAYVLITGESPRFFANQPITELPHAVRQETWANELLGVLNKATQSNPQDRQQNAIEFWKDLARVKILAKAEKGEIRTQLSSRQPTSPKPHVARGYTPLAPQKPAFNTSKELKLNNLQIPSLNNPALVVKIDGAQVPTPYQKQTVNNFPPARPSAAEENEEAVYRSESGRRAPGKSLARRFSTLAIGLVLFGGLLFATHNYFSGAGILPEFSNPFAKPSGVANNDVNLRSEGDANSSKIGMVPKNSRVRIVNSKDNWYEIDVIEYGRPKENGADVDHGWVNKRYINVQE